MRYFVVTHRPLDRPLRPFMEAISTVPAGDGVLDLSVAHPRYAGRGPELSEYATLFALRRHLEASWSESGPPADDEMIGIAQYRRYPVTRPVGVPADVYGMVTPAEFDALPDDVLRPAPGTLLLPSVAQVGTVLGQYGRSHPVRDLLHLMGIAIDLGVVDDRSTAGFLSQSVMVVAPTIGVYPVRWYVQLLADLERVVDAFESRAAVRREGYQRRAVGFCLERLHGMLLAGLVSTWPGDRVALNRAVVVSEDLTYTSGG